MSGKPIRRILWSVDAFDEDGDMQKATAQLVHGFAMATQAKVEPVFVLTPEQLKIGSDTSVPWMERYRPKAEGALKKVLSAFPDDGMLKPRVLVVSSSSTSAAVAVLAKHASSSGADLIIVGTHGRRGVPRFFLGSFAETLLLQSEVPVLVASPKTRPVARYEHIFFGTDLSRASLPAFRRLCSCAQDLGAKLTLYHYVTSPSDSIIDSGVYLGSGWVPAPQYLEQEIERRKRLGNNWLKVARAAGIDAELVVETGKKKVVAAMLAASERRKASLVALAAQSGPLAAAVVGSVTRQVVREATTPVWVLRYQNKRGS